MLFVLVSFLFCETTTKYPYAVFYGSSQARHKLVNYFDIGCTHCMDFYRHIFPIIKKNFCDKGKLLVIYTPYPIHQETLLYMSCCTVLDGAQKKALFETLMEMDTSITTDIIRECMKVLKKSCLEPTSTVINDALSLTDQRSFDSLPVMFFDKKRLSDNTQDHIVQFLEKTCIKQTKKLQRSRNNSYCDRHPRQAR